MRTHVGNLSGPIVPANIQCSKQHTMQQATESINTGMYEPTPTHTHVQDAPRIRTCKASCRLVRARSDVHTCAAVPDGTCMLLRRTSLLLFTCTSTDAHATWYCWFCEVPLLLWRKCTFAHDNARDAHAHQVYCSSQASYWARACEQ